MTIKPAATTARSFFIGAALPMLSRQKLVTIVSHRTAIVERNKLVQNDRGGPLVDELDGRSRAEVARCDGDADFPQRGAEGFIERLSLLGRRRFREAWPVPLRRVGDEGELADDE